MMGHVTRWQRPYRPTPGMVIAALLQGFTAIFAVSITAAVLFTAGSGALVALVVGQRFGARSDAARMRAGCPACGSYNHTIYRCPRASGTRLG